MKKRDFLTLGMATLLTSETYAQSVNLGQIINAVSNNSPKTISNLDADKGIREALSNGVTNAILKLAKLDGYWADNSVRIPLPKPFDKLQSNLKPLGLSGSFDDLHLKINRAAEIAAPKAKTIFFNAIKSFTIEDAMRIIQGNSTAGTDILKEKTKLQLVNQFRPELLLAVDATGAGRAINKIQSKYGRQITNLGISDLNAQGSINQKLADFAANKAIDGIYYYIGREEEAIRKDPMKRTSDILKRVFSN